VRIECVAFKTWWACGVITWCPATHRKSVKIIRATLTFGQIEAGPIPCCVVIVTRRCNRSNRLSQGRYAGVSLDGKVVTSRDVNEKVYGYTVRPEHILNGSVPVPPAAQPLYEALQRCHVYASSVADRVRGASKYTRGQPQRLYFFERHYQRSIGKSIVYRSKSFPGTTKLSMQL
jgi:hypothetical protein